MQFLQLFWVDFAGGLRHQAGGTLGFGESDDVADAIAARHNHHHSVQTEGDTAMGRRAIFKGVQKEAGCFPLPTSPTA